MKNIKALIEDCGGITLGAIGSIECAATAADDHNALTMLVRRSETLIALLKRLDRAIAEYLDTGETADEINLPSGLTGPSRWRRTAHSTCTVKTTHATTR